MLNFVRRRWMWLALVLVAVIGTGTMVAQGAQAKKTKAKEVAAAKNTPTPYAATASGKVDVEGGIIQVAARTSGVVREVDVQEGDTVTKGQVLARLEDDQPRLAVANAGAAQNQAQAQIALLMVQKDTARREYDRLALLKAKNFVAGQALDTAQDKIREADAQITAQRAAVATYGAAVNSSRYTLELTAVRAPVDGRIVRRYANPGSGASTLNVSNMFDLEPNTDRIVRAEIVESDIPHVAVGQQAEVVAEADPTKVYTAVVKRRAAVFGARKLQSDDPSERTDERVVEVVLSIKDAPLLIGQRVLIKFMKPGQIAGVPHKGVDDAKPAKAAA